MRVALLLAIGISFIEPLLNAGNWIVENHTPFTISVQFKIRSKANEVAKITVDPNSVNKYRSGKIDHRTLYGQIEALSLYGIKALEKGNYFGGNENAIILTQQIVNVGDSWCIRNNIKWNVFAIIDGQISPDLPLSIMPKQVRFLLVREELGIPSRCYGDTVTLSSFYDAKTGVAISPSALMGS